MNKLIDHTLLKADATKADIEKLCKEAIQYDFKAVCLNEVWISYAKELLKDSDVLVCTVIGFPLGANTTEAKVFQAKQALKLGADEVDMVINVGKLKDQDYNYVEKEIKAIKAVMPNNVLKVIIETALLSDDEIVKACELVVSSKADFVKTSTGFSTRGASVEDVKLMKSVVKDKVLIKAAGGVKTYADLVSMQKAGASRIGTSSGTALMQHKSSDSNY